nr:MAG TPA: hypothetical protein [Caudoviricetes sp.]
MRTGIVSARPRRARTFLLPGRKPPRRLPTLSVWTPTTRR